MIAEFGGTDLGELDACAREPIRIPGAIQPHGALLVLHEADAQILQLSANAAELLGAERQAGEAKLQAGDPLARIGGHVAGDLASWFAGTDPSIRRLVRLGDTRWNLSGHRGAQGALLEFEPEVPDQPATLDELYPRLQRFFETLAGLPDPRMASEAAAREVRSLTGFNRVLVYRFDEAWNGSVIAEDGDGVLPSYLGLRFPASDIPVQARELYRLNRLRLIPDADYVPVPIEPPTSPRDGAALDLSFAALRSVSPVHLEYMRNMGTAASMSVSLVIDGRLWGLISCHHATPRLVAAAVRTACDSIGQFLTQHLGAQQRMADAAQRIALKRIEGGLLARLALADASGAAMLLADGLQTAGRTPSESQIKALALWLGKQGAPVLAAECLSAQFPPAAAYTDHASGLLAVPVSRLHASYLMWFRPELIHTVTWAGDPHKEQGAQQLHPRRSFERWQELVRSQAEPWRQAEIDSAADFRNAILEFVLRRAEERAALTDELQRSNKELESFSYSVSHDLRAPFRHIMGYAELLSEHASNLDERSRHYLANIADAALAAGRLVDDLLNFSHLNRASLSRRRVDMAKLVEECRRGVVPAHPADRVEWLIGDLPSAWGDSSLLRQVLLNLLSNAVKYSRGRTPAVIKISGEHRDRETVYAVRDNGIGFDMAFVGKLFGVFQRLHRAEDFEGTGIGLALAKRVIERHGGWIAAEGELDQGAVFTVALPKEDAPACLDTDRIDTAITKEPRRA